MPTTISGSTGVTFPAGGVGNTAGAAVGTTDTQTLTNKTLGSGLVAGASLITSGTAVASTSGTSIDFTSIPSWVKRITGIYNGVSTNGTSNYLVQIGTGGSPTSTGYVSAYSRVWTAVNASSSTAGFIFGSDQAAMVCSGNFTITNVSGNIWVMAGIISTVAGTTMTMQSAGNVTLSGVLNMIRFTTVNGTDTFDAGSINILYE
jgi:hypothetical protein